VRFRVLCETTYRDVWVTRSRPGVTVAGSPSRSSCRLRPPDTCVPGFILSCASPLLQSLSSHRDPNSRPGCLPWAFPPSSRHHRRSPPGASIPSPRRSVLDVSHVLDGLLLHRLRGFVSPRNHVQGSTLQGFPLVRSRTSSSPAAALVSLLASPANGVTRPRCSLARLQGLAPLTSPSHHAVV
jgi:hypothetical protein